MGRRIDAPGAMTKIDRVEIRLKQFILGIKPFHVKRNDGFFGFAVQALFTRQKEIPRQLLRDRTGALSAFAAKKRT